MKDSHDKEPIVNLSGYKFVLLNEPEQLQSTLRDALMPTGIKGAVILAEEGINVSIAGTGTQTAAAVRCLDQHEPFKGLWLKKSLSPSIPHKRLRVRVRAEIIAFDGEESDRLQSARPSAPALTPNELDSWLASDKSVVLLDTRNDYEIVSGTFATATQLNIKHFRHFKEAVQKALANGELDKSDAVVTFCTGGIRCEKAAPWLLAEGFREVYQLEGGVVNYLQQTNESHWQGDCFVFDNRVELDKDLQPTGSGLCDYCQLAVKPNLPCKCQLGPHYHATY